MMRSGPPGAVDLTRSPDAPAGEPTDRELLERFTTDRDQDAFAALVGRHGSMVLGVCRRILRDAEEAEDAFQVTFLVLARKAGSLSDPERLANWLYGVACRTAAHMRGRCARRAERERQVEDMAAPPTEYAEERRELLEVLDEELSHLPELYRTLLVLCHLEGRTHKQAARELGCPPGSVSWRVARAREMLHRRLSRRGVVLPAGLLVFILAEQAAAAGLPAGLVRSTAAAAAGYAAGSPGAVLPEQAALVDELTAALTESRRWHRLTLLVLAALLALLPPGILLAVGHSEVPTAGPAGVRLEPAASPATGAGCGATDSLHGCPLTGNGARK
jgi:RNA polymerase sigma factor (sigma-70 family)